MIFQIGRISIRKIILSSFTLLVLSLIYLLPDSTKDLKVEQIGDWTKYSIYSKAGKLGEDFDVYNHTTKKNISYSGLENSAMYYQRTYCFYNIPTIITYILVFYY